MKQSERPGLIDSLAVIETACKVMGISLEKLRGRDQSAALSRKRWFVMYLLSDMNMSSTKIGLLLNRHHATVLYGIDKVRQGLRGANAAIWLSPLEKIRFALDGRYEHTNAA